MHIPDVMDVWGAAELAGGAALPSPAKLKALPLETDGPPKLADPNPAPPRDQTPSFIPWTFSRMC